MHRLMLAVMFALGIAACSNDAAQDNPGAEDMSNLSAIRDVWNFSDPATSETAFRELATAAEAAGSGAYAAEAMTQVARTFSLRREFDQANTVLDEVDAGPHAQVPVVRVRSLLERGRTLNSGGQGDAAAPLFEQAYELAAENDEGFLAGDAIHMLGIVANLDGEERWMAVLAQYITDNPDTPANYWLGSMNNNLGWSYMGEDRFEEALSAFRASREAYAGMGDKRYETLIADYSVGQAMRRLGRCEGALPLQEQTFEALRVEFDTEDEYVAEEIALCRAAVGDREGAVEPAALAFAKYSQDAWFVENEAERLEILRDLSGN